MAFLSSAAFLSAFITILLFTIGILILSRPGKKGKSVGEKVRRLQQDTQLEQAGSDKLMEYDREQTAFNREKSSLAVMLEHLLTLTGVNIAKQEKELVIKFAQSGIYSPDATAYYLFLKRFGILIAAPVAWLLWSHAGTGTLRYAFYLIALVVLVAGISGADLYLSNTKEKRQAILTRSFPDALDLMLVCVEAGLALDAALARVCKELEMAHPLLSKELNTTRMELTLLNDRPRALNNLAERTGMLAFRQLVGSLLQSEKFGTSLTETLRVLSEDYRHTRLMMAENKAGRLPALMTLPLMLFLMPAFLAIVLAPAIINAIAIWNK